MVLAVAHTRASTSSYSLLLVPVRASPVPREEFSKRIPGRILLAATLSGYFLRSTHAVQNMRASSETRAVHSMHGASFETATPIGDAASNSGCAEQLIWTRAS